MSKWIEIAERVEKATGPDEALDAEIWASATGLPVKFWKNPVEGDPYWETIEFFYENGSPCYMPVPSLSASLDAIMALIDRELPYWVTDVHTADGSPERYPVNWSTRATRDEADAEIGYMHPSCPLFTFVESSSSTPALALCGAFCRAMDAMKRDDGKAPERKNAFENGCGNG